MMMTITIEEYQAAMEVIRDAAAEGPGNGWPWDRDDSAAYVIATRLGSLVEAQRRAVQVASCVALVQACHGGSVMVARDAKGGG